jgi:hypothetical protein
MFALRDGKWKMIFGNGSGARTKPVGAPFEEPYQLYDLENDLAESTNLIDSESEIREKLETTFFEIHGNELIVTIPVSGE